jgi:hypothetical protein
MQHHYVSCFHNVFCNKKITKYLFILHFSLYVNTTVYYIFFSQNNVHHLIANVLGIQRALIVLNVVPITVIKIRHGSVDSVGNVEDQ